MPQLSSTHVTQDRRDLLGDGFASLNIDFWTDPRRKEQYGCIVADVTALMYDMANGQSHFMSNETMQGLEDDKFNNKVPQVANLELPLNFERFDGSKTVDVVAEWMNSSVKESKLEASDFGQLIADGGSNAIGSVQEYEVVTRTSSNGRSNNQDFNVCVAHQNQRSAGKASGTADFVVNENAELGALLKKSHEIQERTHRNTQRMKEYVGVAARKDRKPILKPKPSVVTRWDSK